MHAAARLVEEGLGHEARVMAVNSGGRLDRALQQHRVVTGGDRVGFGVSHPCTTFYKWRWMPVVNEARTVVDAVVTCF